MSKLLDRIVEIMATATPEERYNARQVFYKSVGVTLHEGQRYVDKQIDSYKVVLLRPGERWGKSFFGGKVAAAKIAEPYILITAKLMDEDLELHDETAIQAVLKDRFGWFLGPNYNLARADFQYTIDALLRYGLVGDYKEAISTPKDGSWRVICKDGQYVQTWTSEDEQKIASVAPSFLIMTEAGQQSEEAFWRALSRCAEKDAQLILIGTPEPTSLWYTDLFDALQDPDNAYRGFSHSAPSWENTFIYPEGRNDPKIVALERALPEDVFLERISAIPRRLTGFVIPEFDKKKHRVEGLNPSGRPKWLAIDCGFSARSAYAVEVIEEWENKEKGAWGFDVVDELYKRGMTGEEVTLLAMQASWWKDIKGVVIDVAGDQHHAADSQVEMWANALGPDIPIYRKRWKESVQIERHRTVLIDPGTKEPHIRISANCPNLIDEHRLWVYDRQGNPRDEHNHAIKALAYFELYRYGIIALREAQVIRIPWAFSRGTPKEEDTRKLPVPFQ